MGRAGRLLVSGWICGFVACIGATVAWGQEPDRQALAPPADAELGAVECGAVQFTPTEAEATLDPRFRLSVHRFDYELAPRPTVATTLSIAELRFPSPVVTPHAVNNTVHCEYYCPTSAGPHPAVIVLHILGGDFELSRLFARHLAHHGVAALFLKMPYYGPRRDPASSARMVSEDIHETVRGMQQAVLDIRRGAAWLGSRSEIDRQRLGIFGISLGGITAALAAGAEPRLSYVCLMLSGGDIGQVIWDNPELGQLRDRWQAQGLTREQVTELLRAVDPVTYAEHLRGRQILMLNAAHDEVIPRRCTESLWQAMGKPPIVWLDCGHYSAIWYLLDGLTRVTTFFQQPPNSPGT